MCQFFEQAETFDKVMRLNGQDRKMPMNVLARFFSDYRLSEWRQILWSMVEICLTTDNAEYGEPDERANLLLRYQHLESLLEACYLMIGGESISDAAEKKAPE